MDTYHTVVLYHRVNVAETVREYITYIAVTVVIVYSDFPVFMIGSGCDHDFACDV
jgi:hypothetical protein